MAEIPDDVLDLFRQQFAEMGERVRNLNSMLGGLSQSIQQVIRQTREASGGTGASASTIPQAGAGATRQEATQLRLTNALGQMVSALNANTRVMDLHRQAIERAAARTGGGGVLGAAVAGGVGASVSGAMMPFVPPGMSARHAAMIAADPRSHGPATIINKKEQVVSRLHSEASERGWETRRAREQERQAKIEQQADVPQPIVQPETAVDMPTTSSAPIGHGETKQQKRASRKRLNQLPVKQRIDPDAPMGTHMGRSPVVVPTPSPGPIEDNSAGLAQQWAAVRQRALEWEREQREMQKRPISDPLIHPNVIGSQTIPGPTLPPTIPPANVPTPEPAPESGDETAAQLRDRARAMGVPDVKPNWTKKQARMAMERHQQSQQTAQPVTRPVPQVVDTPATVPQPTEEPTETPRTTPGRRQSRKVEKVPEPELPVATETPVGPTPLKIPAMEGSAQEFLLRAQRHAATAGATPTASVIPAGIPIPEPDFPTRVATQVMPFTPATEVVPGTPSPVPTSTPIPGQGWGVGTPFGGIGTPFGANPNVPTPTPPVPTPTPTPPGPGAAAYPWMGQGFGGPFNVPLNQRGGFGGYGGGGGPGAPNLPIMGGATGFSEGGGRDPWSLETTQQNVLKTLHSMREYTRQIAAGIANMKVSGGLQQQKEERDKKVRQPGMGMEEAGTQMAIAGAIGAAAISQMSALASPSIFTAFTGELKILAGTIGESFTPYVLAAADAIKEWSDWLRTVNDDTKESAAKVAIASVAILGIGGAAIKAASMIGAMGTALFTVSKFLLATPWGLAITGATILASTVLTLTGSWNMVGDAAGSALRTMGMGIDMVTGQIKKVGDKPQKIGLDMEQLIPLLGKEKAEAITAPGAKQEDIQKIIEDTKKQSQEQIEKIKPQLLPAISQEDTAVKIRQEIVDEYREKMKQQLAVMDSFYQQDLKHAETTKDLTDAKIENAMLVEQANAAIRNEMRQAAKKRGIDISFEEMRGATGASDKAGGGRQDNRIELRDRAILQRRDVNAPATLEITRLQGIIGGLTALSEKVGLIGKVDRSGDYVPPVKARYTDAMAYRESVQLAALNVPSTEVRLAENQLRAFIEAIEGKGNVNTMENLLDSLGKLPGSLIEAVKRAMPVTD